MDWPGFYGVIITRTGWTYEYLDDLSLCRAIELLEFCGRPVAGERRDTLSAVPTESISEEDAVKQFSALQMIMPGISRLPPELRTAIEWAESEKTKRGLN